MPHPADDPDTAHAGRPELPGLLHALAARYIWWKSPDEAVKMPRHVMAQVMNIGTCDDVQRLVKSAGKDALRDVIAHAQAGQFNSRSWAYWHYRLGLAQAERVTPLPQRRYGSMTEAAARETTPPDPAWRQNSAARF